MRRLAAEIAKECLGVPVARPRESNLAREQAPLQSLVHYAQWTSFQDGPAK